MSLNVVIEYWVQEAFFGEIPLIDTVSRPGMGLSTSSTALIHAKSLVQSGLLEKSRIWSECIIASLRTGKDVAPACARLARKLAAPAQHGDGPEYIPEQYWLAAAQQLGVL